MKQISPNLFVVEDTCQVYVIRHGEQAVLVDFGNGLVLAELVGLGIRQVNAVLFTHHHRDQLQGVELAVKAGIPVWVPYNEQDLFHSVDDHWQSREIYVNYNVRQDRFSALNAIPVDGLLEDYATYQFGPLSVEVLPTPGHTTGSISLLAEVDGRKVAFTGDLIYAPGKVWSLAATQWSYNGGEGLPNSVASLTSLQERSLDMLLPSHGEPITEVISAIELTNARLVELMQYRGQNPRLLKFIKEPFSPVTPYLHLLRSRQSCANSFVLVSESKKALLIDFGYDFRTGEAPGSDRASRRPWLFSIPALKQQFGIEKVDVVIPTHYHDDHVAGINLLRRVEGTQSWVPENFAHILAEPGRFDLPCLWFDPIPADRVLPLGQPIYWEEYTLIPHPLPGHTRYAVALEFEVDGFRVLATGDQHQNDDGIQWNYVYQNRFDAPDYRLTADLYEKIQPDLILSGHWEPLWLGPDYFKILRERGETLHRIHRDLLPDEIAGFGAGGFGARLEPYQSVAQPGAHLNFSVEVQNPYAYQVQAEVRLVVPQGWQVSPQKSNPVLLPDENRRVAFTVVVPATAQGRRIRLAAELTVGNHHFGQQAEALVTIEGPQE